MDHDISVITEMSSINSTQESILPSSLKGSRYEVASKSTRKNHYNIQPTLKQVWSTSYSKEPLTCVACCFTLDGEVRVVVGSHDKTVHLYDGEDGKCLGKVAEHIGLISCVAIISAKSGGGVVLASASGSNYDRRIRILQGINFETTSNEVGMTTYLPRKSILDIMHPPRPRGKGTDGKSHTAHLVSVYKMNQAAIEHGASIASGGSVGKKEDDGPVIPNLDTMDDPYGAGGADFGHRGSVTCLTFATLTDGTIIVVTGGTDKTVRVWNESDNGALWCVLEGHTMVVRAVSCVVTSPFSSPAMTNEFGDPMPYLGGNLRIASASNDESMMIWDGDDGKWLKTLEGHKDKVTSVSLLDTKWGAESLIAISVSYDRTIKIWDASYDGDGVCLLSIGGGLHIPTVQALAIAVIPPSRVFKTPSTSHHTFHHHSKHHSSHRSNHHNKHSSKHNSSTSSSSHRSPKGASEIEEENGKGGTLYASKHGHSASASGKPTHPMRLRIVVGFRGKSVKVWDCLATSTSGFNEAVIGSEIILHDSVSDIAMTSYGDHVFVTLKSGELLCYKVNLIKDKQEEEDEGRGVEGSGGGERSIKESPGSSSKYHEKRHKHKHSPNKQRDNEHKGNGGVGKSGGGGRGGGGGGGKGEHRNGGGGGKGEHRTGGGGGGKGEQSHQTPHRQESKFQRRKRAEAEENRIANSMKVLSLSISTQEQARKHQQQPK